MATAASIALHAPVAVGAVSLLRPPQIGRNQDGVSVWIAEKKQNRVAAVMKGGRRFSHVIRAVATPPRPTSTDLPSQLSDIEQWAGGKRLQTQIADIAPDTTTIRSLDWDRDRFDIEFGLQNGTTYNSFIIRGDKLAIVDASHEKFSKLYMEALEGQVDVSKVDYIIVSHTEPDHSGLVPLILEKAPNAVVVGSKVCIQFLNNLVHKPFKSKIVTNGDKLDLGAGHLLEFVIAPNLHWPDTMFTFDYGTSTLFTCDAFGMHYCSLTIFDDNLEVIEPHYRFYYDCLMKPNSRSVLTALRKVATADFAINTIATGHGPLLRFNVPELMGKYKSWSEGIGGSGSSVGVLYSADYGYSDRLSQALARGITKSNAAVEMMDMNSADPQELVELIGRSSALVVMSPCSDGTAQNTLGTILAATKPKQKVLIAESFGGNDEPVDALMSKFAASGVQAAMAPIKVLSAPTETVYQTFEEAGTDLAQALTLKKTVEEKKSMDVDVAKALARISGGLYIVTASKGDSRSAMVASWVSQASFKPPGLTISVAKDRAIESFMHVGDPFVLNCLDEKSFAPIMKHFLKRFAAGQDRFEGIPLVTGSNGGPVLLEALAFMECTVKSRMETPDHWVVYAEITDGNVSNPDGRTAPHHRKIANYY